VQDLSALAKNSITVTSQAGGNMQSSNENAMTAPGSRPVDPLPERTDQGDPTLDVADKPRSMLTHGTPYAHAPAVWEEPPNG